MKEETDARASARAEQVLGRIEGAREAVAAEEALRDAAREEEQTVGPWGFEKVATKTARQRTTAAGGGRDGAEVGTGAGESGNAGEGMASRKVASGPRDGLGVFKVSPGDGEEDPFCKAREGGGGIRAGDVDDGEVRQLFQPLQQAAHEERWGDGEGVPHAVCMILISHG